MTRSTRLLRASLAGSFAFAALLASPAFAQSAPTQDPAAQKDDEGVHEIVVTAQFRNQNMQEAPLGITAVDSALMQARSQTSVEQLAQRAPGVQFSAGGQGGGAQTASVTIRGIGQNDFQFPNEPGVGIYIDDVYYGVTYGGAFDLVDLDRVEILRGPQGTLSGKNSIGGSIKLFSKKPGADTDGYVEGTYGSFNRVQLKAAANFTLVPDTLFLRLSGMGRHVDGYLKRLDYGCVTGDDIPGGTFSTRRDCVIGREGGQDIVALRGALRWIASPSIEDNLIVDFTHDDSEASPSKSIIAPSLLGNDYLTAPHSYTNYATYTGHVGTSEQFTDPAISNVRSWGVSNNLDIKLTEDLSLTSITAYRFAEGESAWDGDVGPESIVQNYATFHHEQFTQELRLSATLARIVDLTAGGYYYQAWSRQGGRVNVEIAGLDFLSDDPFDQTSKSAFAHAVVHAFDGFNITGGIRYTDEDKTYTFHRRSPIPGAPTNPAVAPLDGVSAKAKNSHTDYRLALDYEFLPDIRAYGQIATGFKGGGINPRPYYPSQAVPFGIETSTSYEAGLKTMLFDHKLRLNGDYFHTDYKGYQGQVSSCPDISPILPPGVPVFCGATRNVGDAKIDGVELEFDARPLPGLSLDGSFSYIDFRFVSGLATSSIVPGVTKAPYVPKWKYALGAQYEIELGGGLGSLTPRIDWEWQSSFYSNIPNSLPNYEYSKVDSRGLLNARLTYRPAGGEWEASLAVTNLTDKFYYSNIFDQYVQSGNVYGLPGRPREFMFSVRRKF